MVNRFPDYVNSFMHTAQLISRGFVQSCEFIFEIWLGCCSLFGPNAEYSNHYRDIPGLGVYLVLSYRGGVEPGEIDDTWGVQGEGVQSMMKGEGTSISGRIASAIMTHMAGIRIPPELLPSLSRPKGVPLELVYQARNPQGGWTGAADGSMLAGRLHNGDVTVVGLPQGEILRIFQFGGSVRSMADKLEAFV